MTRIRGAILDIDGTLLNSNDAHARAWVEALAEVDIQVTFAEVRRLIGMGGDNLLPALANITDDSELGRRIGARRGELFRERYLPKLEPFPQARPLLLKMRDAGLRLAVASSAKKEELTSFLEIIGIVDLIEEVTSANDAKNSKPDPDIVRAALTKLDLDAPEVIMIGDTPYDIQAASALGVSTIAFRCGGRSDRDLAGAIAIYDGAADLLAHYAESPLAARR